MNKFELNYTPANLDPEMYDEFGNLLMSREPKEEILPQELEYDNGVVARRKEINDRIAAIKEELEYRKYGKYGKGTQFDLGALEFILNGSMGGLQSYYNQKAQMDLMKATKAADEEKAKKAADEKAQRTADLNKEQYTIELNELIKNRQQSSDVDEKNKYDAEIQKKVIALYPNDKQKQEEVMTEINASIQTYDNDTSDINRLLWDLNNYMTDGKLDFKKYNAAHGLVPNKGKIKGNAFKSNDDLKQKLIADYIEKYTVNGQFKNKAAKEGYESLLKLTSYESPYAAAYRQASIQESIDKKKKKEEFKNKIKPVDISEIEDDPSSSLFF